MGLAQLEYDREYGCDRRTGWSASYDGHYVAELTTLPQALRALAQTLDDQGDNGLGISPDDAGVERTRRADGRGREG